MIYACHIVPFSVSHNDTITDGISLCPYLCRAFDRHPIAIDDDYKVIISDHFTENETLYSIRPFAGKRMLLPAEDRYFPSKDNLAWHRQQLK